MYRTTYRTESGRRCGVIYALTPLAASTGVERIAQHLAAAAGEPVDWTTEDWTLEGASIR